MFSLMYSFLFTVYLHKFVSVYISFSFVYYYLNEMYMPRFMRRRAKASRNQRIIFYVKFEIFRFQLLAIVLE